MHDTGTRLAHLGVPEAFHAELAARTAPKFHTVVHMTIILVSIASAVVGMVIWSRFVDAAARQTAETAHAILYDSDIGAESLGLLLTTLLAAGWLCGAITWRRGSVSARNGWASDLSHEPAKYKGVTDWLWRQAIRRYTRRAGSANDFLDLLGRGVVRDLRLACLAMLLLTFALGSLIPARLSYATETSITDRSVLPFASQAVHQIATTAAVISGCPHLPKEGDILVYRLQFADGTEANLGNWHPLAKSRLSALESIAAGLPPTANRVRFANLIGSAPVSVECLTTFATGEGPDGMVRIKRLLGVSGSGGLSSAAPTSSSSG